MEFRQVDDVETDGQKHTVAFITSPTGRTPPENAVPVVKLDSEAIPSPLPPSVFDPKLVQDFLNGEYCLQGVS